MKTITLVFSLLLSTPAIVFSQNGHLIYQPVYLHNAGNMVKILNPTDSLHVWGLAYTASNDTVVGDQHSNMEIIYTANGGIGWQTGSIAHTAPSDSVMVSNLWPVDSTTCYLALYNAVSGSGGKLLKTTNAGLSWQTVNVGTNSFQGGFLDLVYFFNPDSGIAFGDPNGGYFEIYTTANGGQTWARTSSGNIPPPLTGETGDNDRFTFSGDSIYVPTTNNRVLISGDKGYTWQVDTTSFATPEWQADNSGYSILSNGANQFYYSLNSGATQNLLSYPALTGSTFSSAFRTKTDNAFITTAYQSQSGIIDSEYLYICTGLPNSTASWAQGLAVNTNDDAFTIDQVLCRNYFYSSNLGWLAGYFLLPDTDIGINEQLIYRYQNCPATQLQFNLPDSICSTTPLVLQGLGLPEGGLFYANLDTSAITGFTATQYSVYQYFQSQDSMLYFMYQYDNNGCYSQILKSIKIDSCPVLAINDIAISNHFSIYPNPVERTLYINGDLNNVTNISVTDLSGRMIIALPAGSKTIDVSNLSQGAYLISFEVKGDKQTLHFIKL